MNFPSTLLPQTNDPKEIQKGLLDLLSKLNQLAVPVANTAAWFVRFNPTPLAGQFCFETDTLSFKVGDGRTAYGTLTYFYRGLPVAGEPSLGTAHKHRAVILNGVDPADTNWHSIDLSAYVPVGTTVVSVIVESIASGQFQLYVGDGTDAYLVCNFAVSNQFMSWGGMIPVSSSRTIQYKATNAGVNASTITMNFYWC